MQNSPDGIKAALVQKSRNLIVPSALPKKQYSEERSQLPPSGSEERSPEQLSLLPEPTIPIAPCPGCGSTGSNLVRMPSYSAHHAARRCAECDSFRGWELKPATKENRQRREIISQLLKSSQLTQWERSFLEGLNTKKISPKQQEVLSRIEVRVGGAR